MGAKCWFLGHKWSGCMCERCGEKRDEGHDWNGCRCARCGGQRDEGHEWRRIPGTCKRRCPVCGREREAYDAEHEWRSIEGECREECGVCGKTRSVKHQWIGCTCKRCGATRDEDHTWQRVEDSDELRCAVCGAIYVEHDLPRKINGSIMNAEYIELLKSQLSLLGTITKRFATTYTQDDVRAATKALENLKAGTLSMADVDFMIREFAILGGVMMSESNESLKKSGISLAMSAQLLEECKENLFEESAMLEEVASAKPMATSRAKGPLLVYLDIDKLGGGAYGLAAGRSVASAAPASMMEGVRVSSGDSRATLFGSANEYIVRLDGIDSVLDAVEDCLRADTALADVLSPTGIRRGSVDESLVEDGCVRGGTLDNPPGRDGSWCATGFRNAWAEAKELAQKSEDEPKTTRDNEVAQTSSTGGPHAFVFMCMGPDPSGGRPDPQALAVSDRGVYEGMVQGFGFTGPRENVHFYGPSWNETVYSSSALSGPEADDLMAKIRLEMRKKGFTYQGEAVRSTPYDPSTTYGQMGFFMVCLTVSG